MPVVRSARYRLGLHCMSFRPGKNYVDICADLRWRKLAKLGRTLRGFRYGRPVFLRCRFHSGYAQDSYRNRPSRGMLNVCPRVDTVNGSCRLAASHDLEALDYQDLGCARRLVTAKAPSKEAQGLAGHSAESSRSGSLSLGRCGRRSECRLVKH
jgi:hypothetical protein